MKTANNEIKVNGVVYGYNDSNAEQAQVVHMGGEVEVFFRVPVLTVDGEDAVDCNSDHLDICWDIVDGWNGDDTGEACDWSTPYLRNGVKTFTAD